jgi:endoglucanase
MRNWLMSTLVLTAFSASAHAIDLKRGLPTDAWLEWPNEETWDQPGYLANYPDWRKKYGAENLALVKAAGFDFMRLTLDPAPFIHKPSAEKTAYLVSGIKAAINDIQAAGLNVIVDLHAMPVSGRAVGIETYLKDDVSFAIYLKLVKDVGVAISDQDPNRVAFEPINEPTIDCEYESPKTNRWPEMAKLLHQTARAAAPYLDVVIPGSCWGGAEGLVKIDPTQFQDPKIIWSFHTYEPFLLTHQGASWTDGPPEYISGLKYPIDITQKNEIIGDTMANIARTELSIEEKLRITTQAEYDLEAYFTPGEIEKQMAIPFGLVKAWRAKYNVPANRILLGEFGVIKADQSKTTPDETRALILKATRDFAEAEGYAWSVWHWGGSFGVTDNDEKRAFSPLIMKALGLNLPK